MARTVVILGCDPGLSGAFAFCEGAELRLFDMPTTIRDVARKQRRVIYELRLARLLQWQRLAGAEILVIEQVGGMPGQSGPAAFTFGYGVGLIVGIATSLGYQIERVAPSHWKASMGVPADKSAARRIAAERFPEHAAMFTRIKDDGRAEAALIALWGQMTRGRP